MKRSKTLLLLLVLFCGAETFAATIKANSNGNWGTGSTWQGGNVPASTDSVVIPNGKRVTVAADATCKSLTLDYTTDNSISINSSATLTITGSINSVNGSTPTSPDEDIVGGSGTIKFTGSSYRNIMPNQWGSDAEFTKVIFDPGANVTLIAAQIIKTDGSITINSGTLSCSSSAELRSSSDGTGGEILTIASGARLITNAQIRQNSTATTYFQYVTINGTLTTTSYVNAKTLTIGSSGVFTTSYVGTQGWWNTNSSPTTVSISSGGTIEFNGSSNQIIPASVSYKNLTLSGSGNYTTSASPLNIAENLNVSAGDHTLSAVNNISGNVNLSGGKLEGSNSTFNVSGNWTTNANTIFQAGTSTVVANGNGTQTFKNSTGGSYEVFYNLTVNNGATILMGSNLQIGNALSVTGTFKSDAYVLSAKVSTTPTCTFNSTASFETKNTSGINGALTLATPTFNTNNNFTYDGNSAQVTGSFLPNSIASLTINNSSGVSLSATTTLSGTLTLTSGALNLNSRQITINNSSTSAISSTSSGYIISESTSNIVQWNMSTTTGAFVFPFGVSGTKIPFTFDKTSSTAANTSVSTRATGSNNTPYASTVTNMYTDNASTDRSASMVIDRWWEITKSAAVTANLTFSYLGSENTLTNSPTGTLYAQHWNGSSWDSPVGSGTGVTSGVGTISASGISDFSPYIITSGTITLPVELINISSSCADNKTQINWTTVSEINNDFFSLEISADGITFRNVAHIDGAGNSNDKINYSFVDEQSKDLSYYRLSQTDFDGTVKFFPLIQTYACQQNNFTMEAYSCKNGEICIQLNSSEKESTVLHIYNSSGQAIISIPVEVSGSQNLHFPINDNSSLVFIQVTDSKGNSLNKKVVVNISY